MILPPYLDRPRDVRPEGLRDDVLDHAYSDVRVPVGFGHGEDASPARPLAEHLRYDHATARECDHRGRWDVLVAEAPERYDAEDRELSREFRLVATCTGCGVVEHLGGELAPERHKRGSHRLDVEPLRTRDVHGRELLAQRINGGGDLLAEWTVYRQRGDGAGYYAVGVMAGGETRRGRAYVSARYGHPNDGRTDETPVVEAPTASGALRKLAKLEPPTTVPIAHYAWNSAAGRSDRTVTHVPDPTTAEAAAERAQAWCDAQAARRARAEEERRRLADRVVAFPTGDRPE